MAKLGEIYKCSVCGNIVELTHIGGGALVCCGQPMVLMQEHTNDVGKEKHVPVIVRNSNTVTVKVGSIPHPMEPAHYIEWIELWDDSGFQKAFLKPGDAPEAQFEVKLGTGNIWARIYCNIHGLWRGEESG